MSCGFSGGAVCRVNTQTQARHLCAKLSVQISASGVALLLIFLCTLYVHQLTLSNRNAHWCSVFQRPLCHRRGTGRRLKNFVVYYAASSAYSSVDMQTSFSHEPTVRPELLMTRRLNSLSRPAPDDKKIFVFV